MGHEYDISVADGVTSPVPEDEICSDCDLVLREEGVVRDCMVSISVVDDDRIRSLNDEWRGRDAATDVISLECERPDDPDLAPGEPCELGDIVLAPAYIASQSARFNTTPGDEFRLLLVHGMLHLLGYDHVREEDAVVMEAREDELLGMLPLDARIAPVHVTRHRVGVDE